MFNLVFFGSTLIGVISGLIIAFIMKRQASYKNENHGYERKQELNARQIKAVDEHNVMTEVAMMLICPYVSYLIAEGLELSGIMSILINGIVLSYYATPNLSEYGRKVLSMSYETIAYSTETLVFLFLGMGLFAFDHPYDQLSLTFVLTTIFNINIARALNVLTVSWIVNKTRSEESKIRWNHQVVMWLSGLRGAMAYALALKSSTELVIGPLILIDTLIFSLFTILVVGSILNPILSRLDVKQKEDDDNRTATMAPN
jgi:sodium/hydrogen exchanger 8